MLRRNAMFRNWMLKNIKRSLQPYYQKRNIHPLYSEYYGSSSDLENVNRIQTLTQAFIYYAGNRERIQNAAFSRLCQKISKFVSEMQLDKKMKPLQSDDHFLVFNKLLDDMNNECIKRVDSFNFKELTTTIWSMTKAQITEKKVYSLYGPRLYNEIQSIKSNMNRDLPLVEGSGDEHTAIHINTLLWSFAKADEFYPDIFKACIPIFINRTTLFTVRELSNIAWAYCRMYEAGEVDFSLDTMFNAICYQTVINVDEMTTQDIANTLRSFVAASVHSPILFTSLESQVIKLAPFFKHQEIVSTLKAYAKMKDTVDPSIVFEAFEMEIARNISFFTPINLAGVASAYAAGGMPSEIVFRSIENELKKRTKFPDTGRCLTDIAWSFAKLPTLSKGNVFKIIEQKLNHILELDNTNTTTTVIKYDGGLGSIDISNLHWAFAKSDLKCKHLYGLLESTVMQHSLDSFDFQSLCVISWSYASVRISNEALFTKIENAFINKSHLFDTIQPQEISMILWAFATLGYASSTLFDALESSLFKQVPFFPEQELANTLWAYALAPNSLRRGNRRRIVERIFTHIINEKDRFKWNVMEMGQIYQCMLEYEAHVHGSLPSKLNTYKNHIKSEFVAIMASQVTESSPWHKLTSSFISEVLRLKHENEFITDDGISVDIKFEGMWKDIQTGDVRKLCLELDGPLHYHVNSTVANPKTMAKVGRLRHTGWHCINLPFFEWNNMKNRRMKLDYFNNILFARYIKV